MNNSVVLLSCINNPILSPVVTQCIENSIKVEAVIMDGELSLKDQENIRRRLESNYKIMSIKDFDYPCIPFYFIKDHNEKGTINLISRFGADYIVNAGTPRVLKKEILNIKKGVLNCHPGLLPKYRGCTCVEWAIYNDDPVGATVHFMDEGIDEGPIISQDILPIPCHQSYEIVRTRMLNFTGELMVRGIKKCYKDNLLPCKLPTQKEGNYFKPIPNDKLLEVKKKLLEGAYQYPRN